MNDWCPNGMDKRAYFKTHTHAHTHADTHTRRHTHTQTRRPADQPTVGRATRASGTGPSRSTCWKITLSSVAMSLVRRTWLARRARCSLVAAWAPGARVSHGERESDDTERQAERGRVKTKRQEREREKGVREAKLT